MGDRNMPTDFVHQWLAFCPGGGAVQTVGENFLSLTTKLNKGLRSSVFGFGSVDEFKQLFTTPDGKFDSGFYLHPNDKMLMAAELVSYRHEPQPIYIQVDFEWIPGKVGKEAVTGLSSVTGRPRCNRRVKFVLITVQIVRIQWRSAARERKGYIWAREYQ
jgi:hypothetical protein